MTLATAVLGATVVVLLGALVYAVATMRRARAASDERLTAAVADLDRRMEAMVAELQGAVARAHEDAERDRALSTLGGTLELDDVLARVLESAVAATAADAALVTIETEAGPPVAVTLGLSADEAERQTAAQPRDTADVRSIAFAYRYTDEQLARAGTPIRSGVAVPLGRDVHDPGLLTVFGRTADAPFPLEAVIALEEIARRAAPALNNAGRFREARQLADLDALTSLHNRRYFNETLAREIARALRYDRRTALMLIDVDGFKEVNDRIGHLAGDAVLAEIAARLRSVVRSSDIPCRIGGDEFAVIMPESNHRDAQQLSERVQATVAARPIAQAGRLAVSVGTAELQPGDTADALFERADAELYRSKEERRDGLTDAATRT